MSRAIQTLLLTLVLATAGFAIEPGNTEKEVLATLGKPMMVRAVSNGAIWKYRDGTSVRIEGGVVKEADGPGSAKDVVRSSTDSAPAPADVVTPPSRTATPSSPTRQTPQTNSKPASATSAAPVSSSPPKPMASPAANPVRTVKLPDDKSATRAVTATPPKKASPKQIVGLGFLGLALLAIAAGNIWLMVVAFKVNVGWGLGCFFIPLVALIFIITHWDDTKKILFFQLGAGIPLLVIGAILMA